MARTCSIENCNYPVWSKNLCKYHSPRTPLKKSNKPIKKISERGKLLKERKKQYTEKQFELFLEIWGEREHYCFETGKYLGEECLSIFFHHCLFKSKYPQYALNKENIVLLHGDIHSQVHVDDSKTPKVREYTKKLREQYGIN